MTMAEYDDNNSDPIRFLFDYDPILDKIYDKLAGTQTVYHPEVQKHPLTNQPITNSEGKPIIFLKQTRVSRDGVTSMMDANAIDFVMGGLQGIVSKAGAFANKSQADIVYETCSTIASFNDNITLSSQKYHITDMGAWFAETKLLRNFIYDFGLAAKDGNLKNFATDIMGVKYTPDAAPRPQQEGNVLSRLFKRRGMVDNSQNFQ
jgi:hypothetical protein